MSDEENSGSLFVVPEDVQGLGRFALDLVGTLRSALESAGREVDSLRWTGTAATSFGTGWDECFEGGQSIIDALTTVAGQLGVAADTYTGQDLLSADRFTNLDLT
ncbi:WXG100 family type VII secretion target [Nocardia sp. NBC_00511]|uniref:WXG100 family type VII secretion target n=1 Tax=Nocardia sp. NBC_00511 TaxID=2903591 RepID=UPI0030E2D24A